MVRVVPLFVLVMLATIALIVLLSAFVMCVKFLFSNKRQTFGILLAGFVLAVIACVVLTGGYFLSQRYEVAEHQARVHYQMTQRQADLQRQVQSELHHHGGHVQHGVVEHPLPPEPVTPVPSLKPQSLAASLEKELANEVISQTVAEQTVAEQPLVEVPQTVAEAPQAAEAHEPAIGETETVEETKSEVNQKVEEGIAEEGRHQELLNKQGIYSKLHIAQFGEYQAETNNIQSSKQLSFSA